MPNRELHNLFAKMLLQGIDEKRIDQINKLIDGPSQIYGSSHRRLFHSPHHLALLALMEEDPDVLTVGLAHLILDNNKDIEKVIKLLQ